MIDRAFTLHYTVQLEDESLDLDNLIAETQEAGLLRLSGTVGVRAALVSSDSDVEPDSDLSDALA